MKSICKTRLRKHDKGTSLPNTLEGFGFHVTPEKYKKMSTDSSSVHKQKHDKSNLETVTFDLNYKMKYPDESAYHFPNRERKTLINPCQDSYWRSIPIRVSTIQRERDDD
jgi:hypothetical protein